MNKFIARALRERNKRYIKDTSLKTSKLLPQNKRYFLQNYPNLGSFEGSPSMIKMTLCSVHAQSKKEKVFFLEFTYFCQNKNLFFRSTCFAQRKTFFN